MTKVQKYLLPITLVLAIIFGVSTSLLKSKNPGDAISNLGAAVVSTMGSGSSSSRWTCDPGPDPSGCVPGTHIMKTFVLRGCGWTQTYEGCSVSCGADPMLPYPNPMSRCSGIKTITKEYKNCKWVDGSPKCEYNSCSLARKPRNGCANNVTLTSWNLDRASCSWKPVYLPCSMYGLTRCDPNITAENKCI